MQYKGNNDEQVSVTGYTVTDSGNKCRHLFEVITVIGIINSSCYSCWDVNNDNDNDKHTILLLHLSPPSHDPDIDK